jgi:glycosyltransferase involved in cell wall biosynthesis
MRIGVDCRWWFRGNPSGRVEVNNMVRRLVAGHPEDDYFLFLSQRDRGLPLALEGANVHAVYLPAAIGMLSVCLLLPWKAAGLGLDASLTFHFPPLAGRFRRIVWIDDVIFLEHPEYFTWKENLYLRLLRPLARRADHVCTISSSEKQRLVRSRVAAAGRISVVPPGVEARFRPAAEHDPRRLAELRARWGLPERFLLYVGRMNLRKNLQNLLAAVAMLRDREIPLVMAGNRDWKMFDLPGRIATLGLGSRVRLLGEVADEDLPGLYALASVFCFVSFSEGFGLPPLEAMASGVPVVVSDRDALPEVCGAAGNYVDPERPAAIAAAIASLLDDPALYARKSRLGLERAAAFTWERSTAALHGILRHEAP